VVTKDLEELTKMKEREFRYHVLKASKILKLRKPPTIKIWDGLCPYSRGINIEKAHIHTDKNLICISRARIKAMNSDEIRDTAYHEVAHMIQGDHSTKFQTITDEAKLTSWMLLHNSDSNVKLKPTQKPRNVCNYHLCNKRGKLYRCKYCESYFCSKHRKPKMAIMNIEAISGVKEPIKNILEEEYRKENAHPDFAYSIKRWEELKMKEEEELNNFTEFLNKLNKSQKTPELKIPSFFSERKFNNRNIPIKKFIFIFLIILIIIYLYYNPRALIEIKDKISSLITLKF
jgi:hypothetical protein